jgi:ABC-type Fe3+-hydroxamate transport system substrate-binding protein
LFLQQTGRLAVWQVIAMKPFTFRIACAISIFLLVCGAAFGQAHINQAQALQVKDDRGVVVSFAQTPQRIVSLLPSLTESVCRPACSRCRFWAVALTPIWKPSWRSSRMRC